MKNTSSPHNSLRIVLLAFIIIPLVFVGLELSWRAVRVATPTQDTALSLHTVVDHQVFGDIVRYTYLGEQLPETLVPEEVVGMRTETSYSRLVTLDDETATVETISYPQQTFVQDLYGAWYYAEYATTTIEAFEARSALYHVRRGLARILLPVAYAVTDTIYAGAGDGTIGTALGTWAASHDATSGTAQPTLSSITVSSLHAREEISCDGGGPTYTNTFYIDRGFLPFDTSGISASATISSASLNVYVFAKDNGDNDGSDFITVVQTSQAGHTTLVGGDFDQCGAIDLPTEGVDGGERKDITSISTSAYLTFTLNSTGLGWIKKNGEDAPCSTTNGISCFGVREGHDTSDDPVATPVVGDCEYGEIASTVVFYASEQTGTSQDPYLSVTYTVPAVEVKRYNVIWID